MKPVFQFSQFEVTHQDFHSEHRHEHPTVRQALWALVTTTSNGSKKVSFVKAHRLVEDLF